MGLEKVGKGLANSHDPLRRWGSSFQADQGEQSALNGDAKKPTDPASSEQNASGNSKLMALYGVTDWSKPQPAEASRDGTVCVAKHSVAVQTQQFETLSVANWLHVPAHDDTLSTPPFAPPFAPQFPPCKRCPSPRSGWQGSQGKAGKAGRFPLFCLFFLHRRWLHETVPMTNAMWGDKRRIKIKSH